RVTLFCGRVMVWSPPASTSGFLLEPSCTISFTSSKAVAPSSSLAVSRKVNVPASRSLTRRREDVALESVALFPPVCVHWSETIFPSGSVASPSNSTLLAGSVTVLSAPALTTGRLFCSSSSPPPDPPESSNGGDEPLRNFSIQLSKSVSLYALSQTLCPILAKSVTLARGLGLLALTASTIRVVTVYETMRSPVPWNAQMATSSCAISRALLRAFAPGHIGPMAAKTSGYAPAVDQVP